MKQIIGFMQLRTKLVNEQHFTFQNQSFYSNSFFISIDLNVYLKHTVIILNAKSKYVLRAA